MCVDSQLTSIGISSLTPWQGVGISKFKREKSRAAGFTRCAAVEKLPSLHSFGEFNMYRRLNVRISGNLNKLAAAGFVTLISRLY